MPLKKRKKKKKKKLTSTTNNDDEQRFIQRNHVKEKILNERSNYKFKMQAKKQAQTERWRQKMDRSPFLVDLLAENERIDEENRVRLREEARRERILEKRKNKVKNEIILKALQEASDLDALRAEKRMILNEERRLKALLDLEKTNSKKKQDMLAAQRAERERKQMQNNFRRQQRLKYETELTIAKREALRLKLGVKEKPKDIGTF